MTIIISLTKSSLKSNFILIINGKISNEDIRLYASSKEGYISWMCSSSKCGKIGKIEENHFLSSLIERCNSHYYCRCLRNA